MAIQLGPNHPDYGKPVETLPPPKPREEHRPRSGRPPRPMPPQIARPAGITRYSLPQLIRAYAAEHDLLFGRPCPCSLCTDLRWHEAQARERGGASGR